MIRMMIRFYKKHETEALRDALEIGLEYVQDVHCGSRLMCDGCPVRRVCRDMQIALDFLDEKLSEKYPTE